MVVNRRRTSFSPEPRFWQTWMAGSASRRPRFSFDPAPFVCVAGSVLGRKQYTLIEIQWGEPLSFVTSPAGDVQTFSTLEQARYWLRRRWPVSDEARGRALDRIEAAMDCVASVGTARRAFISAAKSPGFVPENLMMQS